ncbi:hypothetical protein ACFSMW_05555 [Virgibacillus halophilus]
MESLKTVPSITYFPENETNQFRSASTTLNLVPGKDSSSHISWQTKSTTDKPAYLRQDITFLFANGELRGVHSSWKQHVRTLSYGLSLPAREDAFWQSISLHHAEIHESPDSITGIQQSTADKLYVYTDASKEHSFHAPNSKGEKEIQTKLQHLTSQRLESNWSELARHFGLQLHDYIVFGLTDLQKYETSALPGMGQKQTHEIVGKLWEGIYKNYLLPAVKYKQNGLTSHMPCILLDTKNSEIIVLFDFNGKPYKLIQQIPPQN